MNISNEPDDNEPKKKNKMSKNAQASKQKNKNSQKRLKRARKWRMPYEIEPKSDIETKLEMSI